MTRFLPLFALVPLLIVAISSLLIDSPVHHVYGQSNDNNSNSTNSTNSTYTNASAGFTVKHPYDWEEHKSYYSNERPIVDFNSPVTASGFLFSTIISAPLINNNMSLQEVVREEMDNLKNYVNTINYTESSPIVLGGIPANKIVMVSYPTSGVMKGMQLKTMMIIAIKDGKEFNLQFHSPQSFFDRYVPTIQKIIDSFAFLPSTSTRLGG